MALGIVELLSLRGLDADAKTKLVRHQHARYPVRELLQHGWLELYQGYQSSAIFHKTDQLVAFAGLAGTRARFWGVFRKVTVRPASAGPAPASCPWSRQWRAECKHFYEFERVDGFADLEDRVVIDWGKAGRAWHQRLRDKPVLEIVSPGRRLPAFEDYLEFSLTYEELCDLFEQPEAHRDWQASLSAVGGVYLILAEASGRLYVGSASGVGGIWGRWGQYARSGHGGNRPLRQLVKAQPRAYPVGFRFSILQILPKTSARDEILTREAGFKEKLGSRATGLNHN